MEGQKERNKGVLLFDDILSSLCYPRSQQTTNPKFFGWGVVWDYCSGLITFSPSEMQVFKSTVSLVTMMGFSLVSCNAKDR
mgnify:FL=1